MHIFRKTNVYPPKFTKMVITLLSLVINIFFMKHAPLDSAHTELSIMDHAKTQFL